MEYENEKAQIEESLRDNMQVEIEKSEGFRVKFQEIKYFIW